MQSESETAQEQTEHLQSLLDEEKRLKEEANQDVLKTREVQYACWSFASAICSCWTACMKVEESFNRFQSSSELYRMSPNDYRVCIVFLPNLLIAIPELFN